MSIKLDWSGGSTDIDGYKVYRSETPINPLTPGLPIATLGKEIKTWTDENTPRGKLFYYRVSSYKGSESAITFERAMAYVPYTGPGPTELAVGDWEAGYFGEIEVNDFLPIKLLKQTVGLPLTNGTITDKATNWLKMAYKGKILFIPDNVIGEGYWLSLYNLGLVYGDLDKSKIPQIIKTSYSEVPQNKRVVVGNDEYIFRLPRSRKDPSSISTSPNDMGGGEWDMVYAKLFPVRTLAIFDPVKSFRSFPRPDTAHRNVWMADSYNNSKNIISRQCTASAAASVDKFDFNLGDTISQGLIPVLELVL